MVSNKIFSDNCLRHIDWDYSGNGIYFITINTKNRSKYFGKIIGNKMQLSEIGLIAHKMWFLIPVHFPDVKLDSFIVMPDHIHGIIIIDRPAGYKSTSHSKTGNDSTYVRTPNLGVPTVKLSGNLSRKSNWKPGSLGVIINQYKRICTIDIRKINPKFAWQSRYHDRIIRTRDEYLAIKKYILENPLK